MLAVEMDPLLAGALPATVAATPGQRAGALTVLTADALRYGVRSSSRLPGLEPTALVANLPYNVGGPVLLHLLAELPTPAPWAGDGAGRGGRPAGCAARAPDLRSPSVEGGLVRRGPPRWGGAPRRCSGRCLEWTPALVAPDRPPSSVHSTPASGVRGG